MFYKTGQKGTCPNGGLIDFDAQTGIVTCGSHVLAPAIPVFLNDADACAFSRQRLEKILKENKVSDLDSEDLAKLAEEFEIPLCPGNGKWSKSGNEPLKCSHHEN